MSRKIIIGHPFPPIPLRDWDYSAVYEGYEGGDPIGYGATPEAARADLLDFANLIEEDRVELEPTPRMPRQNDGCVCGHCRMNHLHSCFVRGCKCKGFTLKDPA